MNPDLLSKIQRAQQAGYSGQEITSFLKQQNRLPTEVSQPIKPKSRGGGILASLLPTIGGTAGAVGGGFLGGLTTFGAGAGIGATAGGAGGAALGEKLRQMITGDTEAGSGAIAREAAFGALPGAGKLLGEAKTALTAGKVLKDAEEASTASKILGGGSKLASTRSITPSALTESALAEGRPVNPLSRTAERLFGRQTGITPGAKVGSSILDTSGMPKSAVLKSHIQDRLGAKATDAADTIFARNNDFIRENSARLSAVLDAKNPSIAKKDVLEIANKFKKPLGTDLQGNQIFKDLVQDLPNIKDVKGLTNYKRQLDEIINFSRAGVDPKDERIARAARTSINKLIGQKVPEIKPINQALSEAFDTQKFIQPAAAKPGTAKLFGAVPIPGMGRAQQSLAGVGSKVADLLSGSVPNGTGLGIGREFAKQGATRLGGAALLGTPFVGSGEQNQPQVTDLGAQDLSSAIGEIPSTSKQTDMDVLPQALQIGAIQAIQKGDTSTAKDLISIASTLAKESQATAKQTETSAKAQNANAIINQLENVFASSGGARGPLAGRATLASSLLGGGNQSAKSYQDIRGAYTAQISRALGEVGVLTDKDRQVIQQAIPSVNDSPEAAQIKIGTLRSILASIANKGSKNSDEEDSTAALLQQLGYQ